MNETIKISDLDATSKKYIVWVKGFDYYAGGITGVHRWSYLRLLNGIGWDSRQEAWEWCKKKGIKPYSVSSKDPYGKGAKCQEVKIMRLNKLFKYINSEESWYEKSTYTIPVEATVV